MELEDPPPSVIYFASCHPGVFWRHHTAWVFLCLPLDAVRVGFKKKKKCLLSICFRGSLLNRVNNLSVFLLGLMIESANDRLQFINELWPFGAGTSDTKAALEMLIAFQS